MAGFCWGGMVAWREGYLFEIKKRISFGIPRDRWKIVIGCLILLFLMVGVYVLKKDSADGRLLIWKISVLAMSDRPVLGVGLDHFCGTYGNTQAACFSYPLSVLPLVVVLVMLLALSSPFVYLRSRKLNWKSIFLICACLLLTVSNIPEGKEWREAYITWREEQNYFNMKIYEETVDHYARLYPLLRDEPRFLFECG